MAKAVSEEQHEQMPDARVYKWALTNDETGDDIVVPADADVSVSAFGTWTGGVVTIEGTLVVDPRVTDEYFTALKYDGTAFTITENGGNLAVQNFYRMRPRLVGNATINVRMLVR